MKLTRREFGQASIFSLIAMWFTSLFATFSMWTCAQTIDQVLAKLEVWVPTVINVAQNILALLTPFIPQAGAAAAIIATITGIVQSIISAINEYKNADPATKTTLIGKIRDALQAISDNLVGFVTGLNLSGNPIVKVVGVLLSVVVSAITGYINLLPVMHGAKAKALSTSVTVGGERFAIKPNALDRGAFIVEWNTQCDSLKHPESKIAEAQVNETEKKLKAAN